MMRPSNSLDFVYLCREPVDFRKGINGLSVLVEEELKCSPFAEGLYVFVNRNRDKIKILYWEKSGFCLWQKRLEESVFAWPEHLARSDVIALDGQRLNWLLDGFDLRHWRPHTALTYDSVL